MDSKVILKRGEYDGEDLPEHFEFSYEPDDFQKWGFRGIEDNDNILVTAHTGAGKTALALYAIAKYMKDEDCQVIYTSPIKTLSNQKFKEFSEHFDDVGILTGDVKINPSGRLLIMTAEILRNSLLRTSDEEVYEWNFNPEQVKCVIFDEVHYINDVNRGNVWEEIITKLDPSIQLVMLSATITGAEKLAQWIVELKKKNCYLIPTDFRPVPLKHYLFHNKDIHCIKDKQWHGDVWTEITKKYSDENFSANAVIKCIKFCKENNIMPMNIFLLNRRLTEVVARKIPFNLTDRDEKKEIHRQWDKYLLKYRDTYQSTFQWNFLFSLAEKGIGVHHSGLIPILKEMIEILYEQKLLKVLIATETFALGVNMPTRTVVFTEITKFDGNTKRMLRPEEYNQMAGRAGRRGLDDNGIVIILPKANVLEYEARNMIINPPIKISSKLIIDYNYILKRMILKLEENNKMNIVDYLLENINDTLLAKENNERSILLREKIKNTVPIVLDDEHYKYKSKYIELTELQREVDRQDGGIRTISLKEHKLKLSNIMKLRKKIPKNMMRTLDKWYKAETIKRMAEDELNQMNEQYRIQLEIILNYLVKINILTEKKYNLTPLGRIIAEVNECNCLVLGTILNNNYINGLEFEEIVALFSIFISDGREELYIDDLDISDTLKNILSDINKSIDNFMSFETTINNKIPFKFSSDWNVNYEMVNVVKIWAEGKCKWSEVSNLYKTYEGNFCKNILKLTNVLKNIEVIAKLTNNIDLLNKMEGYQEKLIRDIVSVESLYL